MRNFLRWTKSEFEDGNFPVVLSVVIIFLVFCFLYMASIGFAGDAFGFLGAAAATISAPLAFLILAYLTRE